VAASLSVVGAVCVSLAAGGELEAPALGLTVNLLTPIFLALCITTLRKGAAELSREDNCLGGSMSPVEFTAIKLALSSSVALVLACILENDKMLAVEGKAGHTAWWTALSQYPSESLLLLFGGGVFVLIFQVNITWLAGLTSATAVGIVGEVKVVPQWLINALFNLKVDFSALNILGAVFSLLGSIMYALAASYPYRLVCSRRGLQWQLRGEVDEKLLTNSSGAASTAESA